MINLNGDRERIMRNLYFGATEPRNKIRERMIIERLRALMEKRYSCG